MATTSEAISASLVTAKDNDSHSVIHMRGHIVGRREFFWEDLSHDASDPSNS
jgi:hypothetical protein